MSERREYFLIDTDKVPEVSRRVGLVGLGLLIEIVGEFYCGFAIPDDPKTVALAARCSREEWLANRQSLIDAGEIAVRKGILVPTGNWHKPVQDS